MSWLNYVLHTCTQSYLDLDEFGCRNLDNINGVMLNASIVNPNSGLYLIQPSAITVSDRLMDRLRFIIHTPRATMFLTIGNQSTETEKQCIHFKTFEAPTKICSMQHYQLFCILIKNFHI